MQENTALADQNISTEVDRCIVSRGQALSCMVGEQTILDLRSEAQQQLGAKYNLKDFDDAVVDQGSLPLSMLKEVIHRWIQRTASGLPADQLPYACRPRTLQVCAAAPTAAAAAG